MKNKSKGRVLALTEGAVCVALSFVLELLFVWLNGMLGISALLPFGGTITVSVLPIIYYSYRRGTAWGIFTGLIYAFLQMALGFYIPPAKTIAALILCVVLDYILAFTVMGCASFFARLFGGKRLLGYSVGAVCVCLIRFASSFLSGLLVFNSNFYVEAGQSTPSLIDAISDSGAWIYSLTYNGSYMLANAIINPILIVILCAEIDPLTLKKYRK